MSEIPDLISSAEAAEILGVTTRTIHRFAESGTLPAAYRARNKRGAWTFWRSDVERLAVQRRSAA